MDTPLTNAVQAYIERGAARFHMPGHKGRPMPLIGEAARFDVTEVEGVDSLYEAGGPIAATETAYSRLYGSQATLLSAGGSTLCIQTMLALACPPGSQVICGRGAHTAALGAMALLDLHPVWVYPALDPMTGLGQAVTASQVAAALRQYPKAAAVYLTSPTYFGILSDVAAIAAVCHDHNRPLLIDNAHGAHLNFLRPACHPIRLGADLCCDSLHKTLPVLTGGALLHIGAPEYISDTKRMMSIFGSTSPSYLIMLSADAALPYLEGELPADLMRMTAEVAELEQLAAVQGFALPRGDRDPIRLSLGFGALGLTAAEFRAHLAAHNIEPEYCSGHFCVFLLSPQNTGQELARLRQAITAPTRPANRRRLPIPPDIPPLAQALPLRQAMLGETEQVSIENAAGRVSGGTVAPCPPGIPLVVAGEEFSSDLCHVLKNYGILSVDVLKLKV